MQNDTLKIAAITEDGKTISQHFGRAPYYLVLTVEGGEVVGRELREKLGHAHFANEHHEAHDPSQPHGFSPESHDRHVRMANAIGDCQVLLCGGMGSGAYQSMQRQGIRPLVTGVRDIEQAVATYIQGELEDQVDRLH